MLARPPAARNRRMAVLAAAHFDPHRVTMNETLPPPPIAPTQAFTYERHGVTIDDPWAWLKDPAYPNVTDESVLEYLRAENSYFEGAMAPLPPEPARPQSQPEAPLPQHREAAATSKSQVS